MGPLSMSIGDDVHHRQRSGQLTARTGGACWNAAELIFGVAGAQKCSSLVHIPAFVLIRTAGAARPINLIIEQIICGPSRTLKYDLRTEFLNSALKFIISLAA